MDSAFGEVALCDWLNDRGYLYTMGANKQTCTSWLWKEMVRGLCKGQGRVMKNKSGIIASLFVDNEVHTVYSNAWNQKTLTNQSEESSKFDSGNSSELEKSIDHEMSESDREDDCDAEVTVEKILERRKKGTGWWYYKTVFSDKDVKWIPFDNFVDTTSVSSAFIQFASKEDWMEGLRAYSKAALMEIAQNNGLRRCVYLKLNLLKWKLAISLF